MVADILKQTSFDAVRTAEEAVALIEKGDHAVAQAQEFYAAAGRCLRRLRENVPEDVTWEAYAKQMCGISKQWANTLINIADGKTTIEELRAKNREAQRASRARKATVGNDVISDSAEADDADDAETEDDDELPDLPSSREAYLALSQEHRTYARNQWKAAILARVGGATLQRQDVEEYWEASQDILATNAKKEVVEVMRAETERWMVLLARMETSL